MLDMLHLKERGTVRTTSDLAWCLVKLSVNTSFYPKKVTKFDPSIPDFPCKFKA